ncbi:MAG: helix-turn-helix transcriptional regulator [Bacilli bacterium]|jgi:DNA-binding helix-turn-helix protein|nr:helix-turn-helix transcriptional regulator [Staphylococcus sp.]
MLSSIHTNIRVLREEARLSQEEFADQLNVDVQTVKLWEKGKINPSDEQITKMCPILRIHKEDFLERDILAERTNANNKMKRGKHRSNYDWYYGNRLNMAFYVSYLIIIPIIMSITFIFVGNIFDLSLEQEMIERISSYKIIYQIVYMFLSGGFISSIYVLIYIFKKGILRFQWWFIFWISFAVSILTIICGILLLALYGYAFYKGVIKKGKNH